MDRKYKLAIAGTAIVAAFAVGRYTTPVQIKTETKIVEVEKKVKDTDTDVKQTKTTKTITKPDGTKEETTVTETEKNKQEKEVTNTNTNTDTKTAETKGSDSKTTVAGIVGIDFMTQKPVFGVSVYRSVLGPFGIGLFGLTNGTCGANIGVSF